MLILKRQTHVNSLPISKFANQIRFFRERQCGLLLLSSQAHCQSWSSDADLRAMPDFSVEQWYYCKSQMLCLVVCTASLDLLTIHIVHIVRTIFEHIAYAHMQANLSRLHVLNGIMLKQCDSCVHPLCAQKHKTYWLRKSKCQTIAASS